MNVEPPLEASPKEKFDTLFGLLKDHYAGLFDFEFKNVTVLTLLLGWTLASNDARSFLHTHRGIAYCACVVVLLYAALLLISIWKFYRRSLLAYAQLSELGHMPTVYFRMRRIQPFTVVSFTLLNWAVAFLISAVILFTQQTWRNGLTMRCSELLRASRWLPPAIPPPAPILTLTAF